MKTYLFNLKDDPKEQHNLIGQDEGRAERMEKELDAWQQSVIRSLNGKDYSR